MSTTINVAMKNELAWIIRRRALKVRIHTKKRCSNVSDAGLNTSENLRAYIRILLISSFTSVLRCLVFGVVSSPPTPCWTNPMNVRYKWIRLVIHRDFQ
jgi:hypothetical protein